MKDYVIVPKFEYVSEKIKAKSEDDAIINFATVMDTDMNLYFKAIEADKYNDYISQMRREMHEELVISWMQEVVMEDFDIKDKDKARDLAEWAYDRYCDGNGETEYECVEWAYDQYENEYDDEDEE